MRAVIYICHGSRVPAAREQAVSFIKEFMKHRAAPIQEYCFLELADPTIKEAFTSCMNKGATRIAVVPVLLLSAAHAKKDIPNELAKLSALFPEIEISYGEPIGVHPKMVQPLLERIEETGETVTTNSMVLLIGRGSSDPDVKRDLNKIAAMFEEKTNIYVETCFLTAAEPSLDQGLEAAGKSRFDKVFVIPYLLFTGILMKHIQKVIANHPNSGKFHLCNYLGYHPCIDSILQERLSGLLTEETETAHS